MNTNIMASRSADGIRVDLETRASIYASEPFSVAVADIFGLDADVVRRTLVSFMETAEFPSADGGLASAAGSDAALMIMAFASGNSLTVAEDVEILSGLDFQCEFGAEATDDRKGSRTQIRPAKDRFGSLLVEIMRDIGARQEDRASLTTAGRASIKLGWSEGGRAFARVELRPPYRDVGLLYSTGLVFPGLSSSIRLGKVEVDLELPLQVTDVQLHHFARVVRDLADPLPDRDPAALFENFLAEGGAGWDLPWREGWDLRESDEQWIESSKALRIRRFPGDPARRFRDDDEAVRHVRSLAQAGSPLHRLALANHRIAPEDRPADPHS